MSKLAQRVERVIALYFGVEPETISPQTRLQDLNEQNDLGDSLVAVLEQEFEIELDSEELAQAETVQDVIDLVMFSW